MNKLSISIPIFPLNGAILLPKTNLPLNIFEKRYILMVDYALSHNKTIGMIQSMKGSNKLYEIGCFGKITSFNETGDGRYIINLFGINHFKIAKEIKSDKKFRIFEIGYDENTGHQFDLGGYKFNKSLLLEKFKLFFRKTNSKTNFGSIEKIKSNDLVKLMAMVCPFTVSEKQMLLESKNISILAKNLITLFDFYINQTNYINTIN